MSKSMYTRHILSVALVAIVAAATSRAGIPTNAPAAVYYGGSFDGWARDLCAINGTLPGPNVKLSWGADRFFDQRALSIAAPDLTITESDDIEALGIEVGGGNTIRIGFPDGLALRWDISGLTYGGTAANKVGAASLAENNTVLVIPITSDFAASQTLVLKGLTMKDSYTARPISSKLRLDYDGDNIWDKFDDYTMTLGMACAGGSYDGWALDLAENSLTLHELGTSIYLF